MKFRKHRSAAAVSAGVLLTVCCGAAVPASAEIAKELVLIHAEAEDMTITGSAEAKLDGKVYAESYEGYSGEGFVWAPDSGGIAFDVDLKEGAMYELETRCWYYLGAVGEKCLKNVAVDGEAIGSYYIPSEGGFMDYSFGYFYLEKGRHTIEIGSAGGWGYMLYDTVTFGYADMPKLEIDPTPIDKNATSETKALMKYLTSVYGKQILSGQQEIYGGGNDGDMELEFEYIFDSTGKYPAIRAFDMMNYNPLYGWEDGSTGRMIQWVTKRGGIASASWHLNVPIDFENYTIGDFVDWQECSYKNYQASQSTFNTANILKEGTKEREYFEAAVKMLSEQFQILQDAKVPVIFRPLHEAQGNYGRYGDGTAWFWWGDRGPEVYKELWKLLYKMLTEDYGIHNLLWEINLYELDNSSEWYPGDEYVDMIAYDKYEGSPTRWELSPATSVFLSLVDDSKDTKMVAIAECDKIPDIDRCAAEGAWWSYFCPWYGEYLMSDSNNTKEHLNAVYNSDCVTTLDELPEDLYGYKRGNSGSYDVAGAYECEDGKLTQNDGTSVIAYKFCSGTGYVFLKGEGDAVEQTVTVSEAGTYGLVYGYQQNYEKAGKTQKLIINGEDAGEAFFPHSIMFGETEPILVELKKGENTIKLVADEGWTWLDYIRITDGSDVPPTTTVPPVSGKVLLGDVDCNGDVALEDAVLLAKMSAGVADSAAVTVQGRNNADMDSNGKVDGSDLVALLRVLAGL